MYTFDAKLIEIAMEIVLTRRWLRAFQSAFDWPSHNRTHNPPDELTVLLLILLAMALECAEHEQATRNDIVARARAFVLNANESK